MDMAASIFAFNGVKSMANLAKALNGLNVFSEIKKATIKLTNKVIAIQSALFDAQTHQSTMIQEIDDLKKELVRVKAWEKEKQCYQLTPYRPGGTVCWLKEVRKNGEPTY